MQTYFYVIGSALVVIAFVVSFIGLRRESFPSDGVLRAGVAFVALVVVATAYGAVNSAQDEQQKRNDEANREAAAEVEQETATNAEESGGGPSSETSNVDGGATGEGDDGAAGGGAPPSTEEGSDPSSGQGPGAGAEVAAADADAGAQVFIDNGCGSCHTLADAGAQAQAQIGPNLDEALVDEDTAFIETSIVEPSADVEQGFSDQIMPQNFGEILSPEELANLVAYLSASTGAGSAPAAGGSGGSE